MASYFKAFISACLDCMRNRKLKSSLKWSQIAGKMLRLKNRIIFKLFVSWRRYVAKLRPLKKDLELRIKRRSNNLAIVLFFAWARKSMAVIEREKLLTRKVFYPWHSRARFEKNNSNLKLLNLKRVKIGRMFLAWRAWYVQNHEDESVKILKLRVKRHDRERSFSHKINFLSQYIRQWRHAFYAKRKLVFSLGRKVIEAWTAVGLRDQNRVFALARRRAVRKFSFSSRIFSDANNYASENNILSAHTSKTSHTATSSLNIANFARPRNQTPRSARGSVKSEHVNTTYLTNLNHSSFTPRSAASPIRKENYVSSTNNHYKTNNSTRNNKPTSHSNKVIGRLNGAFFTSSGIPVTERFGNNNFANEKSSSSSKKPSYTPRANTSNPNNNKTSSIRDRIAESANTTDQLQNILSSYLKGRNQQNVQQHLQPPDEKKKILSKSEATSRATLLDSQNLAKINDLIRRDGASNSHIDEITPKTVPVVTPRDETCHIANLATSATYSKTTNLETSANDNDLVNSATDSIATNIAPSSFEKVVDAEEPDISAIQRAQILRNHQRLKQLTQKSGFANSLSLKKIPTVVSNCRQEDLKYSDSFRYSERIANTENRVTDSKLTNMSLVSSKPIKKIEYSKTPERERSLSPSKKNPAADIFAKAAGDVNGRNVRDVLKKEMLVDRQMYKNTELLLSSDSFKTDFGNTNFSKPKIISSRSVSPTKRNSPFISTNPVFGKAAEELNYTPSTTNTNNDHFKNSSLVKKSSTTSNLTSDELNNNFSNNRQTTRSTTPRSGSAGVKRVLVKAVVPQENQNGQNSQNSNSAQNSGARVRSRSQRDANPNLIKEKQGVLRNVNMTAWKRNYESEISSANSTGLSKTHDWFRASSQSLYESPRKIALTICD